MTKYNYGRMDRQTNRGTDRQVGNGVAKLGHTGVRTLATRGCAPPVQALLKIIGAECTVINRELGAKSAQRC